MESKPSSPRGPGLSPAAPPLPLLPGAAERLSSFSVVASPASVLLPQIGPTATSHRHQQRLQLAGAQLRGQQSVQGRALQPSNKHQALGKGPRSWSRGRGS